MKTGRVAAIQPPDDKIDFNGIASAKREGVFDGAPKLYEYFLANVWDKGAEALVLPLRLTSLVGLRLFKRMLAAGKLPRPPQVIYLDSAHEKGETLVELEEAWALLAHCGLLVGDDWGWRDVADDVSKFVQQKGGEMRDLKAFVDAVDKMRSLKTFVDAVERGDQEPGVRRGLLKEQEVLVDRGARVLASAVEGDLPTGESASSEKTGVFKLKMWGGHPKILGFPKTEQWLLQKQEGGKPACV